MNALLVYPNDKFDSYPPMRPVMGLGYVATNLKSHGINVKLLDLRIPSNRSGFLDIIKKNNPDIVCFSILSSAVKTTSEWIKIIKNCISHVKVIVGGPEVTLFPEKIMENNMIDFGFVGEGDFTVSKFLKLYKKSNPLYKKISGLVYREGEKLLINKQELIENLDQVAFPDWNLFDLKSYCKKISNIEFPIMTSRGCPYKCSFCTSSKVQIKYRYRSAENVVEELEYLKNKFGMKRFQILDDNFALVKQRVVEICQQIIKRDLQVKWVVGQGISTGAADFEMFKLMKKAGCIMISMGIESVSQQVLDKANKKITIKNVEKSISVAKKAGLMVKAFFIVGLPGATFETEKESVAFFKRNKIDIPRYGNVIAYPGTALYDWVQQNGRQLADNETIMTEMSHTPGISRADNISPTFETDDFPEEERIRAYKICSDEAEKWALQMKFGMAIGYFFFLIASFKVVRIWGLKILYSFNKL